MKKRKEEEERVEEKKEGREVVPTYWIINPCQPGANPLT